MPFTSNGRGSLMLKRAYDGIGRIRRASGTTDPVMLANIIAALDALHDDNEMGVLERIRDGDIRPIDVLRHRHVEASPIVRRPQFVYVVRSEPSGNLKIGITADPKLRLSQMQVGAWETLALVLTIPGDPESEQSLHRRFRKHRIQGEWFRPSPEVLEWIEEVGTYGHGEASR